MSNRKTIGTSLRFSGKRLWLLRQFAAAAAMTVAALGAFSSSSYARLGHSDHSGDYALSLAGGGLIYAYGSDDFGILNNDGYFGHTIRDGVKISFHKIALDREGKLSGRFYAYDKGHSFYITLEYGRPSVNATDGPGVKKASLAALRAFNGIVMEVNEKRLATHVQGASLSLQALALDSIQYAFAPKAKHFAPIAANQAPRLLQKEAHSAPASKSPPQPAKPGTIALSSPPVVPSAAATAQTVQAKPAVLGAAPARAASPFVAHLVPVSVALDDLRQIQSFLNAYDPAHDKSGGLPPAQFAELQQRRGNISPEQFEAAIARLEILQRESLHAQVYYPQNPDNKSIDGFISTLPGTAAEAAAYNLKTEQGILPPGVSLVSTGTSRNMVAVTDPPVAKPPASISQVAAHPARHENAITYFGSHIDGHGLAIGLGASLAVIGLVSLAYWRRQAKNFMRTSFSSAQELGPWFGNLYATRVLPMGGYLLKSAQSAKAGLAGKISRVRANALVRAEQLREAARARMRANAIDSFVEDGELRRQEPVLAERSEGEAEGTSIEGHAEDGELRRREPVLGQELGGRSDGGSTVTSISAPVETAGAAGRAVAVYRRGEFDPGFLDRMPDQLRKIVGTRPVISRLAHGE